MNNAFGESNQFQELVTFYLGEDIYGVEVAQVVEVNRDLVWTRIPGAADSVLGAANLRGHIVTILDMRTIMEYPDREDQTKNVVIIAFCRDELVGFRVDSIADVVEADPGQIDPPPSNLPETQKKCLLGVLKTEQGLISLLNIDKALAA